MNAGSSRKSNGLVGKWKQVVEQGSTKAVVTYDFKSDGTMHQTIVMKSESPYINIQGEGDCEYTFKNDVITFKFSGDDFNFSKFKMEGVSDDIIEMSMEQMRASMVDVENKLTDVKIDGDELTANTNGIEISMTRM